jgi:ketosteroid isomerase-like protein
MLMRVPAFFVLAAAGALGCRSVGVPSAGAGLSGAALDSAEALAAFRDNIDAIHKRDRARYLASYVQTDRLARNGVSGLERGWEGWSARRDSTFPDTLVARELRVVPVSPGVVYGTYRYQVTQAGSTTAGISERVLVRTPDGWRIAVSTAFPVGAPAGAPR